MHLLPLRHGTAAWLLLLASGAQAQGLPTPILVRADPQMVYPGSPGWLDANGRVAVHLIGENLSPDDDLGHPAGPDGGYQHIFIRGVSPHGDRVSEWVPATAANGCQVYGGAARTVISLGVDPARYLSEPGSHLQVKLWVSASATAAADPVGSGSMSSGWSAIKTIDVAPAGATKPTAAPAPGAPPAISRIVPSDFLIGKPGQDYRLRIYGTFPTGACKVVFAGESGAAVPGEDLAVGYEMTPAWTSTGKDNVFHVTIPAKYRRSTPGQLRIAVLDSAGRTTPERTVTFSAMVLHETGRPAPAGVAVPVRTQAPGGTALVPAAAAPAAAPPPSAVPGGLPPGPQSRLAAPPLKLVPMPRMPEAPADAAMRCQRIAGRIPAPARSRYDQVRAAVLRAQQNPATDLGSAAMGALGGLFPGAGSLDIEALAAVVLMDCSRAAEQDLREALAALDQVNRAKQAQRDRMEQLKAQERRLGAGARKESGALPPAATLRGAGRPPRPTVRTAVLNLDLPRLAPERIHPPEPRPDLPPQQVEDDLRRTREALDDLSELGEALQVRLQMFMDRRAKTLETVSNLLRKIAATEDSVVRNLK